MVTSNQCHDDTMTRRAKWFFSWLRIFAFSFFSVTLFGQQPPPVPQPFPKPGTTQQAPPARTAPQPTPAPVKPGQPEAPPTDAMLGVPIYPGAQFIASYDAGRGPRYDIFG